MARALLACLGLIWSGTAYAQTDPILASRVEYREAVTAYKSARLSTFLAHANGRRSCGRTTAV